MHGQRLLRRDDEVRRWRRRQPRAPGLDEAIARQKVRRRAWPRTSQLAPTLDISSSSRRRTLAPPPRRPSGARAAAPTSVDLRQARRIMRQCRSLCGNSGGRPRSPRASRHRRVKIARHALVVAVGDHDARRPRSRRMHTASARPVARASLEVEIAGRRGRPRRATRARHAMPKAGGKVARRRARRRAAPLRLRVGRTHRVHGGAPSSAT